MKTKLSKKEVEEQIKYFFKDIKNKTPSEIKKIKRIAMSRNIKLGENKKLFCKKCLMHYGNVKVRIKRGKKIVVCGNCGGVSGWKIK